VAGEHFLSVLTTAAADAPTAATALRRWIDGTLRLATGQPHRRHLLVLRSDEARRARGYACERERMRIVGTAGLAAILRRGIADGTLPLADPDADAEQIQAILGHCLESGLLRRRDGGAPDSGVADGSDDADLADRVSTFVFRALGAPAPPGSADERPGESGRSGKPGPVGRVGL
jgi:hypothetical protein